jgi:hypothetical protein
MVLVQLLLVLMPLTCVEFECLFIVFFRSDLKMSFDEIYMISEHEHK